MVYIWDDLSTCCYVCSYHGNFIYSLRVNLDMGKIAYSYQIQKDEDIPDTVVRCTTIPEELGRITYLLSDKTGTLTQNAMVTHQLIFSST